jgi:hypothetical protein
MTTFIRTVPLEEATGTLRELYEEDLKAHGRVRGATSLLSLRPVAAAAWRTLNRSLQTTMNPRHYELATIVAASRVRCSA